jgi:hypothetical protein
VPAFEAWKEAGEEVGGFVKLIYSRLREQEVTETAWEYETPPVF